MNDINSSDDGEILEGFYDVESILERKIFRGVRKYKVKWVGYPLDESTWEPFENLESCIDMVKEFDKKLDEKLSKKMIVDEKIITNSLNVIEDGKTSYATSKFSSKANIIDEEEVEDKRNMNPEHYDWENAIKIINARILNDSPFELNCLIEWNNNFKKNSNSINNTKSKWVSSNYIRNKKPEILLKYYESKIKIAKNNF